MNSLSKCQIPVLEALDLLHLFDDILSPDKSKALKDDKAFYGTCRWRALPKIMVGDSNQYDVLASLGHGLEATWYMNGKNSKALTSEPSIPAGDPRVFGHAGIKIRSLRRLPRVVKRLETQAWWKRHLAFLKTYF
jgi:FMN phosphatase YigB (HAD superfamily)